MKVSGDLSGMSLKVPDGVKKLTVNGNPAEGKVIGGKMMYSK